MTINVIVGKKRTIQVSANGTSGIIQTNTPVTLKPFPVLSLSKDMTIDAMTDVDPSNKTEGATLVYSSNNAKYVVKSLDLSYTTGSLDGGNF